MQNVDMVINPLLPSKFKWLTNDIEICEVACSIPECIDDFRWRPEPSWPDEFSAYRKLSLQEKERFLENNTGFFKEGKVYDYLESRDRIRNKNARNYGQLRDWLKLEISEAARALAEKMLNTYSGRV